MAAGPLARQRGCQGPSAGYMQPGMHGRPALVAQRHICQHRFSPWRRAAASAGAVKTADKANITEFGFRRTFADDFELGPMLGSGSFGVVHVCTERSTGYKYAVKTVPKKFFGSYLERHFVARIQHEVDVYRHMGQSLNIAHLQEAYEDDVAVDLVMELCSGGQLWQRIRRGSYSERQAANIIQQVLQAVAQCHAKGVMVRDVKPDNFLFLDDRPSAPLKMVDFGLAERCKPGQTLTERCGTPMFVAPEVLQQSYSLPADVWSVGILSYKLLSGRFPWDNDEQLAADREDEESYASRNAPRMMSNKLLWRAIMYCDFDFTWPPWDTLTDNARDFVQSMLQRDASKRPTAAQMLQHPWLTGSSIGSSSNASSNGSSSGSSRGSSNGSGSEGALDRPLDDTLVQRLQRYGTYGRLKQMALRKVASVISPDDNTLCALADAFKRLDPQQTGQVPYDACLALLRDGGYDLSEVEIRNLMCSFDLNDDGSVDYFEWVAALLDWQNVQENEQWNAWLHTVFDAYDIDHSGSISMSELGEMLCNPDDPRCVPDTVAAALREADTNHDDAISFEEFAALLQTSKADRLELFASRRLQQGQRKQTLPK